MVTGAGCKDANNCELSVSLWHVLENLENHSVGFGLLELGPRKGGVNEADMLKYYVIHAYSTMLIMLTFKVMDTSR